ncbi:hypothetical protein MKFW12EY_16510 [Methylomonas koyamae]|nr:hypothetical protein MKFW12EY_16510 [Methylomonas koyamae]
MLLTSQVNSGLVSESVCRQTRLGEYYLNRVKVSERPPVAMPANAEMPVRERDCGAAIAQPSREWTGPGRARCDQGLAGLFCFLT